MSFRAMAWASQQTPESVHQKMLLIMLASHMNEQTGQCNPSIHRLAQECIMGVTSVKKHLAALERQGLIVKISGNRQHSNTYKLSTGVGRAAANVGRETAKGWSPGDLGVGRGAATKLVIETGIESISNLDTSKEPVDPERRAAVRAELAALRSRIQLIK